LSHAAQARPAARPRARAVLLAWTLLAAVLFAVAAPRVEQSGLYYDEAFMAQQAKDFFEPERGIHHPPSTRETTLLGRPFPLRNAIYLGALKSQLLIPPFALFGPTVPVLRLTTLSISLLGLLLFMLFAARIAGTAPAVLTGMLVVTDPSYVFLSLYEWGPFTALLLCRAVGLLALVAGWQARRPLWLAAGGFALGLGVFGRADFAVVPAAGALALALARPDVLREALGAGRGALAIALGAAALGAAPMLATVREILATGASPVVSGRGDLDEKLRVLWSLVDGSHFLRLMEVGGRFERMFDVPAPATLLGAAVVLAAAGLVASGRALPGSRRARPEAVFGLAAGLLATAFTLALPGAVRAHHLLNALPFFHLVVALTVVALWQAAPPGALRIAVRAAALLGVAAVMASGVEVTRKTFASIEASGGRGRFTAAVAEPARALEANPSTRGISLDWGFHEPLLFLTRRATLLEPIWGIREAVRRQGAWQFEGRTGDVYFVHDRDYDLFGFGPPFLAAARRLAAAEPGAVEIREHRDREGGLAFLTVRLARPHQVTYRRIFRIELRGGEEASPGHARGGG
jgi:hypothetical protein